MNQARKTLFNATREIDLSRVLELPDNVGNDRHKCRVTYDLDIRTVEFERYTLKPMRSLALVEVSGLDYRFKYADRTRLLKLAEKRGNADGILMARDGHITDTSYANVAFYDGSGWFTPSTFLLAGTKRRQLLDLGIIAECSIRVADMLSFEKLTLINALIDLGEVEVETSSIIL
ncbi:MAG: hypothetical protein HN368_22550 [Spirochaetales bacterium]|nr:hypothetical protein [Spirochaetales bacterium]